MLTKMLNSYLEFRNAKSLISPDAMRDLVDIMLEDYSHLSVEAFAFFFRKCKKGAYGSDYNQVNGTTILQWLEQFDREIDNAFLDMKLEEHRRIKDGERDSENVLFEAPDEEVQRKLNKLIHGMDCTDAELERRKAEKAKAQEIHNRVVQQNLHLYSTCSSVDEANEKIFQLVKTELIANNLFDFL